MESAGSASAVREQALRFLGVIIPNPEIEIHDYALSSHPMNPISGFGIMVLEVAFRDTCYNPA